MWLPLTSTPPVLSVTRTGPTIVLGSQPAPPTSTGPVLPLIVTGPVMVAPQIRTAAAPVAVSGPVMVAPSTSSDPPDWTVTGPVWAAPAPIQVAWPVETVRAPVWVPARHGLV